MPEIRKSSAPVLMKIDWLTALEESSEVALAEEAL
jgi:hypothetical protein